MALPINTGIAVGLQARPQDYTAQAVQSLRLARKEEAMAIAEAKKQRAKDLSDLEKYQGEVSKWAVSRQSGLLPIDQEIAKAKAQIVLDAVKTGDKTKVYEAQLELNKFADSAKMSAQNLMKQGQTGIEHPDKFAVKQEIIDLANSVGNPENYAKWQQLTGGTGFYMSGLLDPIDKTDWLEGMQRNVVGSGLKYQSVVDPQTGKRTALQAPSQAAIDNTWSQAKLQSWYPKAVAQKTALGIDPEIAEAEIKKTFITSIPKEVSSRNLEEKKAGGGLEITVGGAKSGKFYYNLENLKSAQAGGKTIIIFGQEGGTQLPFNSFLGKDGKEVIGRPTGKLYNTGKSGKDEFEMEMLVPKKAGEKFDFDMNVMSPETHPDKYEKMYVPITNSPSNKKKFQGEYGGQDINEVYKAVIGGSESEKETLPLIKTKSEFDALPKGAKYTKADGKTYTKG